ncbi:MAG: hypothetical protein FJ267_10615, partial [Planctomycetes bacterium]|nr:hypothetical protein [Planctomycetota bacterium]
MGHLLLLLLMILPIVLVGSLFILRIVAESRPETPWMRENRRTLSRIAYIVQIAGIFILLGAAFLGIHTALFGVAFLLIVGTCLINVDIRLDVSRLHAQETELLWVLATALRSQRDLAAEIEEYAKGAWGRRNTGLLQLAARLRNGHPEDDLIIPKGLLPEHVAMEIHSGLVSGKFSEAVHRAAVRHSQQTQSDRDGFELHDCLIYPLSLLVIMGLIVSFVMYYIIPKFKKIFDDFNTELPSMSVGLVRVSDLLINHWYILILLLLSMV